MPIRRTLFQVVADLISFFFLFLRPRGCLAAENLFLRKQLVFFQERKVRPRRIDPASKLTLVLLSKLFDWKEALVIVRPAALIRWHREALRLFWRWKSKPGRPSIPADLRALIRQMAREKPLWGEERIAGELLLHDRSGIFSKGFDDTAENMGLRVIKTPYRSPQANSICERAIGTFRRECLDHLIPLTREHFRRILKEWVTHYNRGRPHSALGPGIPEPPEGVPGLLGPDRYRIADGWKVESAPVLGGLHHEYRLIPRAA